MSSMKAYMDYYHEPLSEEATALLDILTSLYKSPRQDVLIVLDVPLDAGDEYYIPELPAVEELECKGWDLFVEDISVYDTSKPYRHPSGVWSNPPRLWLSAPGVQQVWLAELGRCPVRGKEVYDRVRSAKDAYADRCAARKAGGAV